MDLRITKTDGGFELAHPALPAPVVLGREAGKQLSAQLLSPDLNSPAWKQDKCLWSPQSREPIGLWVLEDGTISLWVAGQNDVLTLDEAREMGNTIAASLAKFPIGTKVLSNASFSAYRTEAGEAAGDQPSSKSFAAYTEFVVSAYDPGTGYYEATTTDGFFVAKSISESYLASLSGDQRTYEIIQYAYTETNPHRTVRVDAVNTDHAAALASAAFGAMKPNEGWTGAKFAPDWYDSAVLVDERTIEERNAADGWSQGDDTSNGRIKAIPGGPFADDTEARDFVMSTALTPGAEQRYIDAARRSEGL